MLSFKKICSIVSAGAILASAFSISVMASSEFTAGASASKKVVISSIDDSESAVITTRFPLSIGQKTDDLINLGIISGDADGDLRLDDNLTRAEFAKIICNMLGLKQNMSQESLFSDVDVNHWASGYITTAKKCGIINGYGDGTFRPDNNVTFQEVLKMTVCALGYFPMADARGGYPAGYITIANQLGITSGVTADTNSDIDRKTTFEIVHYAVDVPLMQQTGFGESVEYTVMNGQNNLAFITLRTNLLDSENDKPHTTLSSADMKIFVAENSQIIKEDIENYRKRMKYEGEYSYEITSVSKSNDGNDITVTASLFEESQNKYILISLNYRYIAGKLK